MSGTPSHFFAFLARMRFIQRWGLMHNTHQENIAEHSLRVAMISHALVLISNTRFGTQLNADRAASLALYHDASEVLTGDLPAPIKYFNPAIQAAYKAIEHSAELKLISMLPADLRTAFAPYLATDDATLAPFIKAADKLCAYLKCLEEMKAGNQEFARAERTLLAAVEETQLPAVSVFLELFTPSFRLTLDELD